MQSARGKAEALGRKAKLARSYQELLDEFSNKDLKSVGNYTLGRLIGKGSFGKVYLATHKLTNGSKVVLKSANKGDSNLAREIHHHRQFVHPHIARLYEVIVTETLVWLVLEYCPGDELYNHLVQHGRLPVDKVQRIFAQLVGAVSYVHQQSCVHRDLKLENILLDKNENVKLCDFGFTREYEGKANYLQTFCGTICYSAPEMLKGEKYAGERVDVWSLGVILYALLTGELPFDDDDDAVTRNLILTAEPKYPEYIPADALALLKRLLSKRPLLRPCLPDILSHPFLAEHAPQQQAILNLEQPAPFSTGLEKETLQRMRSAGVDIDSVIESVLSQRCDALGGWWTLLIEKEERKAQRRERKRKEKEAENRVSRRFSQSSRLEKLATVGEEATLAQHPPLPRTRGRAERRSGHYPGLLLTDLPVLADLAKANGSLSPDVETPPPPPIDKDSIRSASSSRHRRPIPPPKEGVLRSARSRGSTLHLMTTTDALSGKTVPSLPVSQQEKVRKKTSQVIVAHWKNWTHWLFERPKRHRGSHKTGSQSTPNLGDKEGKDLGKEGKSQDSSPRPQTSKYPTSSPGTNTSTAGLPKGMVANGYAGNGSLTPPIAASMTSGSNTAFGNSAYSYFNQSHGAQATSTSTSHKRLSLSPSPLTPRGTVRRTSGPGLRGRKSTSSSVSSIRSMHHTHHHSHSKASSTSSNGSVSTSMSKTPLPGGGRSPHHSVKVLPATPTNGSFPSNIRLVRDRSGPPLNAFNEGMPNNGLDTSSSVRPPGSPNPFSSGGIQFAKRKRNIFKGPMLSLNTSGVGSRDTRSSGSGSAGHSRNASASGLGRRSGEITIQEVDEDEEDAYRAGADDVGEDDEDVEEVDAFSPIVQFPGETVEEKIYEEREDESPGGTAAVAAPMTPAA
jgi:serine/threonine protein kinase